MDKAAPDIINLIFSRKSSHQSYNYVKANALRLTILNKSYYNIKSNNSQF